MRGGGRVVMATEIAVSKKSLFCGWSGTWHIAAASPGSTLFSVSRLWKSSLCLTVGVTETLWLDYSLWNVDSVFGLLLIEV